MPLVNHFAAVVTFAPELQSGKKYDIVQILPQHGDTIEEVVATFEDQGHLGAVFEAADDTDASIVATNVLPHAASVATFSHIPNRDLNVKHGALDLA